MSPLDTIRERLARCTTRADVLRVGDAWGALLARNTLPPEVTIQVSASAMMTTERRNSRTMTDAHPEGEYAIIELFGHTTLVGRIAEVERFGTKMLAIEALFRDTLLPAVFHGGASIYRLTPCSAETAFSKQPRSDWHLPTSIRCIVPPRLLSAPDSTTVEAGHDEQFDDGDEPF